MDPPPRPRQLWRDPREPLIGNLWVKPAEVGVQLFHQPLPRQGVLMQQDSRETSVAVGSAWLCDHGEVVSPLLTSGSCSDPPGLRVLCEGAASTIHRCHY